MENNRDFTKTLKNGVRVVYRSIPGLYSVAFGVLVGVGSRFENSEVNGYSHFIEHLLFKGTSDRTAMQIPEIIEGVGGQINAYTSKDTTCFYTITAKEHLETGFELISDMFFNSLFAENEIKREKKVILEEISMCDDMPDEYCHDLLSLALYKGQQIGQTVIGTPKNIKKSTRESLLEYKDSHYTPQNVVISVAGNIDFETVCKFAEKYFSRGFECVNREQAPAPAPEFTHSFLHKFKEVEQSHIALAYPYYAVADPDVYAGSVFSNIFGGGMSSRLFQNIREQHGLAYSIFSFGSSYSDTGYFEIYAGTNPSNVTRVIKLINAEVKKILDNGVSVREFERAKAQLSGSTVLAQDSSSALMRAYGSYMLRTNTLMDIDERLRAINAVTIDDVNRAMRTILADGCLAAAYVGKKIEDYNIYKIIGR